MSRPVVARTGKALAVLSHQVKIKAIGDGKGKLGVGKGSRQITVSAGWARSPFNA